MDEHGILTYEVTVVSAEYDNQRHTWMYTLKDYRGDPIVGRTPETELEG